MAPQTTPQQPTPLSSGRVGLSVHEVAFLTGLATKTIYDAVNSGALAAVKIGRIIRIAPTAVDAWFAGLPSVVGDEAS